MTSPAVPVGPSTDALNSSPRQNPRVFERLAHHLRQSVREPQNHTSEQARGKMHPLGKRRGFSGLSGLRKDYALRDHSGWQESIAEMARHTATRRRRSGRTTDARRASRMPRCPHPRLLLRPSVGHDPPPIALPRRDPHAAVRKSDGHVPNAPALAVRLDDESYSPNSQSSSSNVQPVRAGRRIAASPDLSACQTTSWRLSVCKKTCARFLPLTCK